MHYKQARRKVNASAIVNAGFRLLLDHQTGQPTIKELSLCYGGMSCCTVAASNTEQSLIGRYKALHMAE